MYDKVFFSKKKNILGVDIIDKRSQFEYNLSSVLTQLFFCEYQEITFIKHFQRNHNKKWSEEVEKGD